MHLQISSLLEFRGCLFIKKENILRYIFSQSIQTVCLLLIAMIAVPAQADGDWASDIPGNWKPWAVGGETKLSQGMYDCANKEEYATVIGKLKDIHEVWKKTPGVYPIMGYTVDANAAYEPDFCLELDVKGHPRRFNNPQRPIVMWMRFYPFTMRHFQVRGKNVVETDGETHGIELKTNSIPGGNISGFSELTGMMPEPVRVADRFGQAAYSDRPDGRDDMLLIRNNDRPLYKPVRLIAVYDGLLEHARKEVASFEAEEEQRRKRHNNPQPDFWYKKWVEDIKKLEAARTHLLAEQPDAPAFTCYQSSHTELTEFEQFHPSSIAKECRAVVTVDPDYFDKKLPKTAIQLIKVQHYQDCLSGTSVGCPPVLKLLSNMDWNAMKSVMDK